MSIHTLALLALTAGSVAANPIALRPLLGRQYSNTSLPVITQTSADQPSTSSISSSLTCTTTALPIQQESCGDIATKHGVRLSAFEADVAADSATCRDLLASYGVCVSISANATSSIPTTDATASTLSSTLNGTLAIATSTPVLSPTLNSAFTTITAAPNTSFVLEPTAIETTTTKTRTTALTYTLGTGTSASIRTAVVTHTTIEVFTYTDTVTVSDLPAPRNTTSIRSTVSVLQSSNSTVARTTSSSSFLSTFSSASSFTSFNAAPPTSSSASSSGSSTAATLSARSKASSSTDALASSSSSACTVSASAPAPTQSGVVSGCTQWYVAVSGDYCSSVAQHFGVPLETFEAWNPAVDAPLCPNMLAGDAYCVATCGGSSSTAAATTLTTASLTTLVTTLTSSSSTLTVSSTSTSLLTSIVSATSAAVATSTAGVDVYKTYTGDGSIADGWPSQSQWVNFTYMFDANTANMKASCAQWGVPDDSDDEVANMKTAIENIASSTGVDERLILAIIMQESTGCVRVITTEYSVFNPGLMQSHNGTGTCNTNNAALGLPGVVNDGTVQTPCPATEIHQQIEDGVAGTSSGDGLEQCLEKQGHTDVSRFYRAARMYNGGSIDPSGDLGKGCCTLCYASDIANRLTGWVNAAHTCDL